MREHAFPVLQHFIALWSYHTIDFLSALIN